MKLAISKLTNLFHKNGSVRFDPARDWLLLLAACFAFIVASVAWNVWFFDRVVEEGASASVEGTSALGAYEAGGVNKVFDARAESAAAYREGYQFVDPSR